MAYIKPDTIIIEEINEIYNIIYKENAISYNIWPGVNRYKYLHELDIAQLPRRELRMYRGLINVFEKQYLKIKNN
jgi:hypothetical protein